MVLSLENKETRKPSVWARSSSSAMSNTHSDVTQATLLMGCMGIAQ